MQRVGRKLRKPSSWSQKDRILEAPSATHRPLVTPMVIVTKAHGIQSQNVPAAQEHASPTNVANTPKSTTSIHYPW